MRIACIGWGSLFWDPQHLPITDWRTDGPWLPIEFTRVSANGRVTLVVDRDANPVRTLWTDLKVETLDEAVEVLRDRENVPSAKSIGRWPSQIAFPYANEIGRWATSQEIDGVVWTALKVGFDGARGVRPTLGQLVAHLSNLDNEKLAGAREYIDKAPPQVETAYRLALAETVHRLKR